MVKKSLQAVVQQNLQLGFDPDIIKIAYNNVNGDADRVIQQIFRLQEHSSSYPTKPSNPQDEDAQLSKAIQISMNQAKDKKISLQPLNPEQRIRKAGVPVGLKNIGNTCYFNSLLQTYFQNFEFVKSVLSFQTPSKYKPLSDTEQQKAISEDSSFKRKQASCKLIQNLKILFSNMIASDRKYADPTDVISSIVDEDGNQLQIGDQKDIGQFNLVFLSRLDEGFQLLKNQTQMKENKQQNQDMSSSRIAVIGDSEEKIGLIHRSSIKIEHNSLIDRQFFGNMVNFYENQAQKIHQVEEEQFSLLFVNVRNKQLYNAIEHITIQHIDDYRNEKGEVVGVQKQSWIKVPPKTLFFQIDRVTFDKEKCQLYKINDEFQFPNIFYIDPFLLKNKDQALKIQKNVKKLRQDKARYTEALKKMEKFGEKNINLLDMLTQTTNFLAHQSSAPNNQQQLDQPTIFPNLKSLIKPEQIDLLKKYAEQIDARIKNYHQKIKQIDSHIEKCYQSLRSTPYHLYSILIHQGSADTGHYYSYTYDFGSKLWRKFNDINISQEVETQVMKEATGLNYTSAYYLVYAQKEILVHEQSGIPLRNYEISSNQKYLGDYYSQLIPPETLQKIKSENQQLYYEIQQYKMGAFANRVAENYTKIFQKCNEAYRKTKTEKKKTNPPNLTNLPVYLKDNVNQEAYKSSLIENSISEYGPKEYDPIFEEMLKKKMSNFNDFKKPKQLKFDQIHAEKFMGYVIQAQVAQRLFQAIKKQEYKGIIANIKFLQEGEKNQYFDWLSSLLCKIIVVRFLQQAEDQARNKNPEKAISRLKYLLLISSKFINRAEEKILINNCFFWISQIAIMMDEPHKEKAQSIAKMLMEGAYEQTDQKLLQQANSEELINQLRNSTDIVNSMWNLSRHQNTLIENMLSAREQVKSKMESANNLYKAMKKTDIPLKQEERDLILKPK